MTFSSAVQIRVINRVISSVQMAQELGIIEKDENYINPYKQDAKMVSEFSSEVSWPLISGILGS